MIAIHDELSQLQFVRDLTLETFSELWVLKVSDEEVKFFTSGDPTKDENNLTLLHPGCKLMLVTEGGEGCRYYTPVCQSSFSIVAFCDHLVRFSVFMWKNSLVSQVFLCSLFLYVLFSFSVSFFFCLFISFCVSPCVIYCLFVLFFFLGTS